MEKNQLKNLIKTLALEIIDEEELDEITTTGDVEGYESPFAFTGNSSKSKKKKKKISTNSTGYKVVSEELEKEDLKIIKRMIRNVIGDVLRDIWIKRNAWK